MVSTGPLLPTVAFLQNVERLFSARFPADYMKFCAGLEGESLMVHEQALGGGQFITDLEMFEAINASVGEEQWAGYERAIADRLHPRDGNRLWGGLLPFYFDANDIYGFSAEDDSDRQVYVWSVHAIVHAYPSWAAFVEARLGL